MRVSSFTIYEKLTFSVASIFEGKGVRGYSANKDGLFIKKKEIDKILGEIMVGGKNEEKIQHYWFVQS